MKEPYYESPMEKQRKIAEEKAGGAQARLEWVKTLKHTAESMKLSNIKPSDIEVLVRKYDPSIKALQAINQVMSYTGYSQKLRLDKIVGILKVDKTGKKAERIPDKFYKSREGDSADEKAKKQKDEKKDYSIKKAKWKCYPNRNALLNYHDKKTIVTSGFLGWMVRKHKLSASTSKFFRINVPAAQKKLIGTPMIEYGGRTVPYLIYMLMDIDKFKTTTIKTINGKQQRIEKYDVGGFNIIKKLLDFCLESPVLGFKYTDLRGRIKPNVAYHNTRAFVKEYFKLISNEDYVLKLRSTIKSLTQKDPSLMAHIKIIENEKEKIIKHDDEIMEQIEFLFGGEEEDAKGKKECSELEARIFAIPYSYYKKILPKKEIILNYVNDWKLDKEKLDIPEIKTIKNKVLLQIKNLEEELHNYKGELYPILDTAKYCKQGIHQFEEATNLSIKKNAKDYTAENIVKEQVSTFLRKKRLEDLFEIYEKSANDEANLLRFRYCALHTFKRFFCDILGDMGIKTKQGTRQIFASSAFKKELGTLSRLYTTISKQGLTEKSVDKEMLNNRLYAYDDVVSAIKRSSDIMYTIGTKLAFVLRNHKEAKENNVIPIAGNYFLTADEDDESQIDMLIPYSGEVVDTLIEFEEGKPDETSRSPLRPDRDGTKKGTIEEALSYIAGFCYSYSSTLGNPYLVNPEGDAERLKTEIKNIKTKLKLFPDKLLSEQLVKEISKKEEYEIEDSQNEMNSLQGTSSIAGLDGIFK